MSTRRKERRSRQRSRRCIKTSPPFARKDTKRKRKKEKRERERERERERIKQLRSGTRIGSIHHRQIRDARCLERRKKLEKRPRRRTCTASLVVTGDVVAISSRLFPRAQHERKDGDKDQQTPVGTNFEDAGIGTRQSDDFFVPFLLSFFYVVFIYSLVETNYSTYVYLLHALALTSLRLHVRRRRRRRRRRRQRRSDFPRI